MILKGDQLTAVDLTRLGTVQLKGGGKRGTIMLGPDDDWLGSRRAGWGMWTPSSGGAPRFLGIENAKSVFTVRASSAA